MKTSLPSKIADLAGFLRSVASTIESDPASVGIDPSQAAAFSAAANAYHNALLESQAAKFDWNSKTVAAKAAKAAALGLYRSLASQVRANPAVTNESVASIGTSRRKAPSPISATAMPPIIWITKLVPGGFKARYMTPGTRGCKRAPGAIGVLFSVVDGTNHDATADDPARGAQSFQSRGISSRPLNASIGKPTVRVYACWMTARGLKSPWSRPFTLRLPPA